jgi:hypothetical protein
MRFRDGAAFLRLNTMALVGMSAAGKRANDLDRERLADAIVNDSADVTQRYTDQSELSFELGTNLVTGKG